jgi:hypothetical protein
LLDGSRGSSQIIEDILEPVANVREKTDLASLFFLQWRGKFHTLSLNVSPAAILGERLGGEVRGLAQNIREREFFERGMGWSFPVGL